MSKSELALTVKKTTDETFFVGSESDPRVGYTVNIREGTCECPQYQHRGLYCKHQDVVDDSLILSERIPIEECNSVDDGAKHLSCVFQNVMLDRGYIMIEDCKWKKKEFYEKMEESKKPEVWLSGSPDKLVHPKCKEYHLFEKNISEILDEIFGSTKSYVVKEETKPPKLKGVVIECSDQAMTQTLIRVMAENGYNFMNVKIGEKPDKDDPRGIETTYTLEAFFTKGDGY